ncbi:MAG TPA: glycosyl hydrolase [Candidatus Bathyarchaeia archaeon]|nr:glycosyl hydrolase [Candidatus Bathyarchaeia archaeon]
MPRHRVLVPVVILFALAGALAAVEACRASAPPPAPAPAKPANAGMRTAVPFDTVRASFKDPDMIYAPFIFWFWDEPLDPAKMGEMSRVMAGERFNPGYAHARHSMVGTPDLPDAEWLGDQWFASFDAALKEAESRKSYLGYCDEYWWPSFQANGRILKSDPTLRAVSLSWKTLEVQGGAAAEVPASFCAVAAEIGPGSLLLSRTLRVIGAGAPFSWTAPAGGPWRIYVFDTYSHPGADGSSVNYLDARLAPKFIGTALEPYARRLGDKLGRSIPGDFIDNEGDYGWGLAWSATLDERYKERYGRDLRLWLPLSVDRDAEGLFARARWEWFDLVSDIYASNFRAVTDWNEARGMSTTIHFWEEGIQPQVSAVGDHMKLLRSVTMPGQDCLGRKPLRVHDFKEIESVAEFGNVRAATELMGAGAFEGTPWGTFNPPFLKQAANAVTAWGMSHVIPHAVFATRKLTGNPWPPDWYSENPMFPYLHLWNDFVRRASFVNSQGRAVPDVLLYNPIESAWMQADAGLLDADMWKFPEATEAGRRVNALDRIYAKAIDDLTAAGIEFLVGDRFYLGQMEIKEGRLVRGEFEFRTIVLPALDILPLGAARKIVDFAKSGGRVYALAELPAASAEQGLGDPEMKRLMDELRAQPAFAQVGGAGLGDILGSEPEGPAPAGLESQVDFESGNFPMLRHHRRIDGRDFFWLVNNSGDWQECGIVVRVAHGAASIWDCETGAIRPVGSGGVPNGSALSLVFKPYEAFWLVFDPKAPALAGPIERRAAFDTVTSFGAVWRVSYDPAVQPVMEFPLVPPAEFAKGVDRTLDDWSRWGLEKFSGLLDYVKIVKVEKPERGLLLDLGKVGHAAEVWVNGRSCGARLWGPYLFPVGEALRPGENEIRVRVANLINNIYGEPASSGLFGPARLVRPR